MYICNLDVCKVFTNKEKEEKLNTVLNKTRVLNVNSNAVDSYLS